MTDTNCASCQFYTPIQHRGQRYPKGRCDKHSAYRLSNKFAIHLTITSPLEFVCESHEPVPQKMYALVGEDVFLIPPVVASDLVSKGWVRVQFNEHEGKIVIRKEGESE